MPVQWLLETRGSYDLDPVYFPTHLFPGVHRDHVVLGQEKVSRKGQILVSYGEWGKEGWEGEGGPRHTSQFSGGSPGWQDENAWLGFRTLGGRRPGLPGSAPRRRQASPPTFFKCLSRPPFTYQGKEIDTGKKETPLETITDYQTKTKVHDLFLDHKSQKPPSQEDCSAH